MPFSKGQSGNPGGKRKRLGLSQPVRASEGLKTWAKLLQIRDKEGLEAKELRELPRSGFLVLGRHDGVIEHDRHGKPPRPYEDRLLRAGLTVIPAGKVT